VRQQGALNLIDALTKMTLMPAQRLERRVPSMKNKGRIRIGADADLTIFDPQQIIDKSTFQEPAKYSEGIKFVLVNGVLDRERRPTPIRSPRPPYPRATKLTTATKRHKRHKVRKKREASYSFTLCLFVAVMFSRLPATPEQQVWRGG
jgi:N-acyl-D-aspartate/D-glutamate deacylase